MNEIEEYPDWIPLKFEQMPQEIQQLLASEFPDGPTLRDWAISEFEKQCSSKFAPRNWSDDDAKLFRQWWWYQFEKGDFAIRKSATLQNMLHLSLSSKASALSQRHCQICSGLLPSDSQFPVSVLPIRIAPQSRQSLGRVKWDAFQAAMRDWFKVRNLNLGPSAHFCVALTYVLDCNRQDRDLDNMTKALMDAFSRAIGIDDKNIHHLDVLKLIGDAPEEYVIIRIAPSYLQDQSTVMITIFDGKWGVGPALRLEDFIAAI